MGIECELAVTANFFTKILSVCLFGPKFLRDGQLSVNRNVFFFFSEVKMTPFGNVIINEFQIIRSTL